MFGGRKQRRFERAPFQGTVAWWKDRSPQQIAARDVSPGGLFLKTEDTMTPGALLTLRVALRGFDGFTVLVKVVREQRGRWPFRKPGMAVSFVDIRPRDRDRLLSYVGGGASAMAA